MDILSVNAETQLMKFASTVGQSQHSWRGWHCLRIAMDQLNEDLQHECLFWAKSLLTAYLEGVDGRIYFCEGSSIHIVSKGLSEDVLMHAGSQICALVFSESGCEVSYDLFDLAHHGDMYAKETLERNTDILNRVYHKNFDADDSKENSMIDGMLKAYQSKKTIEVSNSKVLLVEDDPVTRWLVRNALKDSCDLATASTANKAFSLYSSYQPDVVFLDINLPDKNGYEVLAWIMRNDPGAKVVMFSSQSDIDNITDALERGASGFIGKPFVKDQLLNYTQS